jgi:hypothetical protein
MERKPIRTRLQNRVIKGSAIAPSTITAEEVDFGTAVVTGDNPADVIDNPKDGLLVIDPDTKSASVYSEAQGDYVDIQDSTARASADGKNTIYRSTTQPTGGTYVTGDTWFDEDDNNKIYRYNGTSFVALQLGGNALANISANSVNTGTLNANLITVSNLDVGTMTTGNLSATRISAGTISASISLTSPTITTGSTGNYVKISTTNANQIQFFSTNQATGYPGLIYSTSSGTTTIGSADLYLEAPRFSGSTAAAPYIALSQRDNDGTGAFGSIVIHPGSSASDSYILLGAPTYAVNVEVGGTASGSQFTVNGDIGGDIITADSGMRSPYFEVNAAVAEFISAARNIHVVTSGITSGGSATGYYNGAIVLVREA